jgi:hypothetical protein
MHNNDHPAENNDHPDEGPIPPERPWDNMAVEEKVEVLQEMNGHLLRAQGALLVEVANLRRLVLALVAHADEGHIPAADPAWGEGRIGVL